MTMADSALTTIGLSKSFRRTLWERPVVAVDRLDLTVRSGEVFGVLGPNGAGKSTIFRLLTGLIRPTSGQAWLFNRMVGDPQALRAIGYLPDQPAPYEFLTAKESLTLCGRLGEVPPSQLTGRVTELLNLVNLTEAADRRVRTYSKGMRQRLGIAQALVHDPALLLLDEPMSGLDPIGRTEVQALLVELKRQGKTIIFSSHLLQDVATLCDRVGILVKGRMAAVGRIDEMLGRASMQQDDPSHRSSAGSATLETVFARYAHDDRKCAI